MFAHFGPTHKIYTNSIILKTSKPQLVKLDLDELLTLNHRFSQTNWKAYGPQENVENN